MHVSTLVSSTGEIYADINDLILLLEDVKKHPENYNKDVIFGLINQLKNNENRSTVH